MAGFPIVEVLSGGIAATDTPNGAPVSVGTSGMAVTWVTSGGIPLNKGVRVEDPQTVFGAELARWYEPDQWGSLSFGTRPASVNTADNTYPNRGFLSGVSDLSPQNADLAQATNTAEPRLVFGAVGGKNSIRFEDDAALAHLRMASTLLLSGDFTICIGFNGFKAGRYFVGHNTTNQRIGVVGGKLYLQLSSGGAIENSVLDFPTTGDNWLWLKRESGKVYGAFNDADWVLLFGGADVTQTVSYNRIGGIASSSWQGEVFAFFAASRAVSKPERTRLWSRWVRSWVAGKQASKDLRPYYPRPSTSTPTLWSPSLVDYQKTLADTEDLIVNLPQDAIATFPLDIVGGRTVVINSGYMRPTFAVEKAAIKLRQRKGLTYIEGVACSRADCNEDIDFVNVQAPASFTIRPDVYLQNIVAIGFTGTNADHHSDIFQCTFSGMGRFHADNVSADTNYQGFILVPQSQVDATEYRGNGPNYLRRVSFEENAVGGTAADPANVANMLFLHNPDVNSGLTYLNTWMNPEEAYGLYILGNAAKNAAYGLEYARLTNPGPTASVEIRPTFTGDTGTGLGYLGWPSNGARGYEYIQGRAQTARLPLSGRHWIELADIWDGERVVYRQREELYQRAA